MLEELHVRDLALIGEAWLEFGPGMTVLTGETGAGKTALLGALKLILGERADAGAVRSGAAEALVEARFGENGREILARRRVSADGRSRCSIDGEMATVGSLTERIGPLVDLHGQHEHQSLLHTATHAAYLDRWAGDAAASALERYSDARQAYREAEDVRARLEQRLEEASRNADYLRFVADEIARVEPLPGEDESLQSRLPALQHAEKLAEAAGLVAHELRGEGGALDRLAQAGSALEKVAGIDSVLDELAGRIAEVVALTDDVGLSARSYRDSIEDDPTALDATLARLATLSGLVKKYGPTLDDVLATARDAARALEENDDSETARAAAAQDADRAKEALLAAGEQLAVVRRESAPGFAAALEAACADLSMPHARFEVAISESEFEAWTAAGPQRIEFLYAPVRAQQAKPLARIASGGELSRVMLALKGVLGSADQVETLVFDEVDAGIGGATAQAVGRRLLGLSATHQVIVVTHLAQVAAFADAQLVVSRDDAGGDGSTRVTAVTGDTRVAEIARMLSGEDSDASRVHARELLEHARTSTGG